MVGIKNNRRTIYTLEAIKSAFLALLETKELSKITVTEICRTANINRGTFYHHFSDTQAVFNQIEDELLSEVFPILLQQNPDNLYDWLKNIVEIIKKNESIARIILAEYPSCKLLETLFHEARKIGRFDFQSIFPDASTKELDYYFIYFYHGSIAVISEWLEHDREQSVEEITHILYQIISRITLNP